MTRALATGALAALLLFGCRRNPPDLREWTPADHGRGTDDPGDRSPTSAATDPLSAGRALFAAQCASCHGSEGRGDGPQAMLFRPSDLTSSELQSARTDDDLARAITNGRGRMPAFGAQLRPEGVQALVRLIRSWRR